MCAYLCMCMYMHCTRMCVFVLHKYTHALFCIHDYIYIVDHKLSMSSIFKHTFLCIFFSLFIPLLYWHNWKKLYGLKHLLNLSGAHTWCQITLLPIILPQNTHPSTHTLKQRHMHVSTFTHKHFFKELYLKMRDWRLSRYYHCCHRDGQEVLCRKCPWKV